MYDIIIIGGGPAGLTAALYARRAGKTALVLEKNAFGGQITWSPKVENFPTAPSVSGLEWSDRLVEQVMDAGAELELEEVTGVEENGSGWIVRTLSGTVYEGRSVILATGAKPRRLGLPDEEKFIGAGISFCAVCDGTFYKGRTVAVSGGGNSALQEAIYLSDLCEKVYLIHRRGKFRADRALIDAVADRGNVCTVMNSTVTGLRGDDLLSGICITDADGKQTEFCVDGLFVAIGHEPECEIFRGLIALDEDGYADAGEDCRTGRPGIYVAGDCRKKTVRQLTTAVADGAVAALAACGG